ncbi:MAG: hypothetical protein EAZ13_02785 [Sphingobacteriia bacterium]|nr:MAG: hypothetical protein EAZ13_02785 [Sphingobacteriia bacterium]
MAIDRITTKIYFMSNNTQNLAVLAKRFKVEELKQRIEFDIAMEELDAEAAGGEWKDRKTSASVSVDSSGKPKAEVKVTW